MSTLLPFLSDSSYCNSCGNYHRPGRNPTLLEEFLTPFATSPLVQSSDNLKNVLDVANAFHGEDNFASSLTVDKNKFQANFDVQHFKPKEISVKVTGDNAVTIEAKHEEKQDAHGQIYRHFVRKYVLPKNCDLNKLESRLSIDGVLTISAPTFGEQQDERVIPIAKTGQPARTSGKKENEKADA